MNFEKYVATGNAFIKEVAQELGNPDDKNRAMRVTRAVIHALRNRLTPEEFLDFISQLPMCIKAIAVDGWKIDKVPEKIKHVDEFIEEVLKEDGRTAPRDFGSKEEAVEAVKAVFRVIKRHVTEGEVEDIAAELPKELKQFFLEA